MNTPLPVLILHFLLYIDKVLRADVPLQVLAQVLRCGLQVPLVVLRAHICYEYIMNRRLTSNIADWLFFLR